MKLRTNKNSIRLRLSQTELEKFRENGFLHEYVQIGIAPESKFSYSLISADHTQLSVSLLNQHLRVFVPLEIAKNWTDGDDVGFESKIKLDDQQELYVLVEKDFQCITPRAYEDESDNFPNPNAALC